MNFLRSDEPNDATRTIEDDMESIGLQHVDEASAVPYPSSVDGLHVEQETEYRAEEQLLLHQAEGLVEARPLETTIGALDAEVSDLKARIDDYAAVAAAAKANMDLTNEALARHVRRPHGAEKPFYVKKGLIFLGDVVGVSASLINFGLLPWMAGVQGLSIGGAIVALGQAGLEAKQMQRVRELKRLFEDLTDPERHFSGVFAGPTGGESVAKLAIYVTAAALLLIFGGVMSVQWATDGLAAGLFFGCLGAAIGLASAINYWAYGDFVADIVNNARADYAESDAKLAALVDDETRRTHGQATAELRSLREEHELRGQAARLHMLALGKKVLRNNPGVAGHGPPAKTQRLGRAHSNGHTSHEVGS